MTLQEILANKDPEQLRKLLGLTPSLPNASSTSDLSSESIPVSAPKALSPTPVSPEMLGMLMKPNASTNLMPSSSEPSPISAEIPAMAKRSIPMQEPEEESDPSVLAQVLGKSPASLPPAEPSRSPAGFSENTVEGLRKAQEEANHQQDMAMLFKGINSITSGVLGKKHHTAPGGNEGSDKLHDERTAQAQNKIKQFQERGEKEKEDPGSQSSANMREFARPIMQKLGIKMPENMSYSQMEKVSPLIIKMYEGQEARQAHSDDLKFKYAQMAAERADKKASALTEGQKAVDKDFAKHYNEWQATGKPTYEKNMKRLADAKAALEKASFGTSGRVVGSMPNMLRSEESKRIQQDVQAAAQGSLKATLGAQFTEKEGERIMNMAYDPTLSPDENIRKIDMAMKEIQDVANSNDDRSKAFETKGTLAGYSGSRNPSNQPAKIIVSNGKERLRIDPSDLKDAEADGYKKVE